MALHPLGNPLLIVSDNPSMSGGLSRMCRDLATLCCTVPQLRVAVLGRGVGNRRTFPFMLYDYPETGQWGEGYIQAVWEDFSNGEDGVIITLDDASRRHWFANPIGLPEALAKFLGTGRRFRKWMYLPVDSTGPNGSTLSLAGRDCVSRYDRVLASSEWGAKILVNGGRLDTDWLPHGIWRDKFHIRGDAKSLIGQKHGVLVGCVMANQQRKDYPVAFRCLGELRRDYGNNFNAWVHTDELIRYWNLPALAAEYGLGDCLEVTMDLTDEQLALRYSACDCTILPSGGEGFGFPIAESLACGTSCIVSDYAGGAELVPPPCRSKPVAYKVEGPHSVLRPVLDGQDFALLAKYQIEVKRDDQDHTAKDIAQTVDHLSWDNLRYEWTKWLVEGLT